VRLLWGDYPLADRIISPPAPLAVGERDADLLLPRSVLPEDRMQLVRIDRGRVLARTTREEAVFCELFPGEHGELRLGAFTVEIDAEAAVGSRFPRLALKPRRACYFAASLVLHAGALGALAYVAPSELEREQMELKDQVLLMQQYLKAGAERENEPGDAHEGGSGARAKGEVATLGRRFAVRAQAIDAELQTVRAAALSEAREFGMIGLLNTGASPSAPPADGAAHARSGPDQGEAGDGAPLESWGDLVGAEEYADHGVNPAVDPSKDPLSTFAIDVDTGSYMIAKRKLLDGVLPPLHAVRAEEFLNAFDYAYPGPESEPGNNAFKVHLDAVASPFARGRHLLRVALQGRRVPRAERPPLHLVYLVDTSGSMQSEDKIGLVQTSLRYLTDALRPDDTVALCTYAGSVSEILSPTELRHKQRVLSAIDSLTAGGSTAMASGIDLAYDLASRTLVPGHESRVIVLSDGDANVGPTSPEQILGSIAGHRKRGITLSTVGFGRGNYKDTMMERFANAGDGNYSYIGSDGDAKRVFSKQVDGLLHVIARDVKLQVVFDPAVVSEYRLIGYENRDVADKDFRNDDIDGGEVGSGHSVTALYDVVLKSVQRSPVTLNLRYKLEAQGPAVEQSVGLRPEHIAPSFAAAEPGLRFAVAVVALAEVLRGSPHALGWDIAEIERIAASSTEQKAERIELLGLVGAVRDLRRAGSG
jgi:Ca-activated chloride channel homolog